VEDTLTADTVLYLFGFVAAPPGVCEDLDDGVGPDVLLVGEDAVALAASVVHARDYQPPADGSTPSDRIAWITPLALRHHDIVRRLHAARTVVPLKFGALCPDVDHAVTIVRRLRDPIAALLDRFQGKDEWTLRVTADRAALEASLRGARPGLARLEQDVTRMSDGAAYLARKRLQQLIAGLVSEEGAAIEERIWDRLAGSGLETIASPSERTADDRIAIAHGALLVDRRQVAALEATLAEVEDEHATAGVTCELAGPWPPYSFTETLEVV
jgi:gas vesicle protein GvpL/GvpF